MKNDQPPFTNKRGHLLRVSSLVTSAFCLLSEEHENIWIWKGCKQITQLLNTAHEQEETSIPGWQWHLLTDSSSTSKEEKHHRHHIRWLLDKLRISALFCLIVQLKYPNLPTLGLVDPTSNIARVNFNQWYDHFITVINTKNSRSESTEAFCTDPCSTDADVLAGLSCEFKINQNYLHRTIIPVDLLQRMNLPLLLIRCLLAIQIFRWQHSSLVRIFLFHQQSAKDFTKKKKKTISRGSFLQDKWSDHWKGGQTGTEFSMPARYKLQIHSDRTLYIFPTWKH